MERRDKYIERRRKKEITRNLKYLSTKNQLIDIKYGQS